MHGIAATTDPTPGISTDQIAYSVKSAAEQLEISERYLWLLVKEKKIPSIKVGRARRILRSDLVAFAESRRAK